MFGVECQCLPLEAALAFSAVWKARLHSWRSHAEHCAPDSGIRCYWFRIPFIAGRNVIDSPASGANPFFCSAGNMILEPLSWAIGILLLGYCPSNKLFFTSETRVAIGGIQTESMRVQCVAAELQHVFLFFFCKAWHQLHLIYLNKVMLLSHLFAFQGHGDSPVASHRSFWPCTADPSCGLCPSVSFCLGPPFPRFLGVIKVRPWGCFPLTQHSGGDFDHGKIVRPVCFGQMRKQFHRPRPSNFGRELRRWPGACEVHQSQAVATGAGLARLAGLAER